jgi:hypothetical protein
MSLVRSFLDTLILDIVVLTKTAVSKKGIIHKFNNNYC